MFEKTKSKIHQKIQTLKKAAFLAFISYIYDKVVNKKDKKKYIENVDYEVEKKDVEKLK